MQTSCRFLTSSCLFRWTVVELGGDPLILISFLGFLFSPGPYPMGLFQKRYMKSPKAAYLKSRTVILHFALLQSLHNTELSYHGHCSQGCLLPSQSQSLPFFMSVSRASLLTVFFCHLEQEVVTALQDPSAPCMPQVG